MKTLVLGEEVQLEMPTMQPAAGNASLQNAGYRLDPTLQYFHFFLLLLPLKETDFYIIQELLETSFRLYMKCQYLAREMQKVVIFNQVTRQSYKVHFRGKVHSRQ